MTKLSIASYSFHRLLGDGKQDMFQYIQDCKRLGATQLDPWNGHLALIVAGDEALKKQGDFTQNALSPAEKAYLVDVRQAAQAAGLPFGCLAVDGAHIYEATDDARRLNRCVAYRNLEAARLLGAEQVRIDAGGPPEMPVEIFKIIVAGYQDLLARCQALGLELLIENHWGPSNLPENLTRLFSALPGLGLLFDTNNWAKGRQHDGWRLGAPYARSVHIKTFEFDAQGNDPTVDIPQAMQLLLQAGYQGCWGVESVPRDGDEIGAVEKTFALIRRILGE